MNKIAYNMTDTIGTNVDVTKYISAAFGFITSFYYLTLHHLIVNPSFIIVLSLVTLDTMLGLVLSLKRDNFSITALFGKSIKKILKYGFLCATAILVGLAPLKLVAIPFMLTMLSYVIIKESSSVFKNTSDVFDDKDIGRISDYTEDIVEQLFKRIQESKNEETPQSPPPSDEPSN